ncbi:uncharacterized protein N7483_004474 [Penicillium malachiteum]|uniref:uncharacterized protein n=1 Tax=Penicillium malachiteum TaxID=1324776 RepID=UPI0025471F7D|nr:uncharacterized protein N7483_004474 [Penicillium malachiteum]KAJ5729966.1 hypothetical protein N7483_004474 [Penicillium malachiteum]
MARLNTAKSEPMQGSPRKSRLNDKIHESYETSTTDRLPKVRYPQVTTQKQKKGSGAIFDIFADADQFDSTNLDTDQSSPSTSPTKLKRTRTLKSAKTNSLLLPLNQRPSHRTNFKVETDDYDKENDLTEYGTDSYSAVGSPASYRSMVSQNATRTPTRSRTMDTSFNHQSPEVEDTENFGDNSFNSLDDFIVRDDEDLSYQQTSEPEVEIEIQRKATPSPPKPSRRRLMRGRRPGSQKEHTDQDLFTGESLALEVKLPESVKIPSSTSQVFQDAHDLSIKLGGLNIDEDSKKQPRTGTKDTRPKLDTTSKAVKSSPINERPIINVDSSPPSMKTDDAPTFQLKSPTKKRFHIPPTPHRESSDAFWDQEVTNTWIEQHSPRKVHSIERSTIELLRDFDDSENEGSSQDSSLSFSSIGSSRDSSESKTPSKTALRKAEAAARKKAKEDEKNQKSAWDNSKDALAKDLLHELDQLVTDGEFSRLTKDSGGVKIIWSKTLVSTAGRANYKHGPKQPGGPRIHTGSIELAEHIITDEYRLINTLTHEFCHLLNYIISRVTDNPHGESFKKWGQRCEEAMRDHPIYGGRIHVTTKHSYKIDFKYVWTCVGCGQTYGRKSKSIDPARVRCGQCKGCLEQTKPKPRNVSPKKKNPTVRAASSSDSQSDD